MATLNWQQIELVDHLSSAPPRLGDWIKTERAQVIGGWLVRTYVLKREVVQASATALEPEFSTSVSITFVPDPAWAW